MENRIKILISFDDKSLSAECQETKYLFENRLKEKHLDGDVEVVCTNTIGILAKGISVAIFPENIFYREINAELVDTIIRRHIVRENPSASELENHIYDFKKSTGENRIVLSNIGIINPDNIDDYILMKGYYGLEKIVENHITPEDLIDTIKQSGLRGRGGAGFPTGLKWELTAKENSDKKFIVCNADEGEPGTFKDRLILEGNPHRIIEGMILAGYAAGAEKGYIYIRGEYSRSAKKMEKAIRDAYERHYLGEKILNSDINFDIELRSGAGAYVCGEETSLLESIEGKRGNPRIKPPYPGQIGLWGYPTVVNNVETLSNIAPIVVNGADWFSSFGTEKSPGTKVFMITGDVVNEGAAELPLGVTLREIIYEYGGGMKDGKRLKAIHLGGTSGAVFDDSILDLPIDYDTIKEKGGMLGSGAVLVMNEERDMKGYLKSVLGFFKHESCGQCVPCRIGTVRLYELLDKIDTPDNRESVMKYMEHLAEVMFKSSLCPLGQSVIFPVKSIFKYFGNDF